MDEKYILHVTRRYLQKEYQKKNKYGATVCEYAKNINFTKKQFDTFDMWVDFSLKKNENFKRSTNQKKLCNKNPDNKSVDDFVVLWLKFMCPISFLY